MEPEQEKKSTILGANRDELLTRFISILLTALVSALITFLQSLLLEPESTAVLHEQIGQAGVLGATLRTAQEIMRSRNC